MLSRVWSGIACISVAGSYSVAACDITGARLPLIFDATELQIFKGNLGSPSNPNLQYGHFEPYHCFYESVQCLVLIMEFYGIWQLLAMRHRTPNDQTLDIFIKSKTLSFRFG